MKDIVIHTTIKGFPLIKFQTKDIIEKTVGGEFYMNSLRYYRELYEKTGDEFIGDPCEGKIFFPERLGAQLSIPKKEIFNQDLKDVAVSTPSENDFVFCMFAINPNNYDDFIFSEEHCERIISAYDTALIITDVYEYCKRIKIGAEKQNIEINSDFVNYYDEYIDSLDLLLSLQNGMKKVVFYKRKKYAVQKEYRFTSPNPQNDMYLKFDIGDISGISVQLPSKDLFNAIISKRR